MATKVWSMPRGIWAGEGVISSSVGTASVTVRSAEAVMLPNSAEICTWPGVRPLANPAELMVATFSDSEDQRTKSERSNSPPVIRVPVAVNC